MKLKLCLAVLAASAAVPAAAQQVSYANFSCNNGVKFPVAYGPGYASVQIDGKSLELTRRRLSVSGTRYSANGVVFIVKGINARLTHGGITSYCIQDY